MVRSKDDIDAAMMGEAFRSCSRFRVIHVIIEYGGRDALFDETVAVARFGHRCAPCRRVGDRYAADSGAEHCAALANEWIVDRTSDADRFCRCNAPVSFSVPSLTALRRAQKWWSS